MNLKRVDQCVLGTESTTSNSRRSAAIGVVYGGQVLMTRCSWFSCVIHVFSSTTRVRFRGVSDNCKCNFSNSVQQAEISSQKGLFSHSYTRMSVICPFSRMRKRSNQPKFKCYFIVINILILPTSWRLRPFTNTWQLHSTNCHWGNQHRPEWTLSHSLPHFSLA